MSFTLTRDKGERMWGGKGSFLSNRRGGGGSGAGGGGGVSSAWVDENYVSKDYFNQLFEVKVHIIETDTTADPHEVISDTTRVLAPNEVIVATSSATDPETGHTIVTTMALAGIQAKTGLWTNSYLSALGQNSGGGGGGGGSLNEPLSSINMAGLSAPGAAQDGQTVVWDNSTGKWKYGAAGGGAYLPLTGGTMANTNLVTNMNADMVDGLHDVSLFRKIANENRNINFEDSNNKNGVIYINRDNDSGETTGFFGSYGSVLNISNSAASWQLGVGSNDVLKYRSRWWSRNPEGSDWTDWKEFAFTTSNVASATKLQTARTLWGQSFDGTANVSGSLSNTGHITSSTHKTYNIGTSTNMYNSIYGKWIGAGENEAFSMGANNGYAIYINTTQNVGVGTATPGYKLEVNGTLKATKFYLSSSIYFELDANNHVHLVGAGFYSDSFVSALGLNSSGGGGGGSSTLAGLNDVSLGTLAANDVLTYDGNGHWVNTSKATLLTGYATQQWVQSQGYLTASSLNGYLPLTGGTMANTNLVTNMNADLLDGKHASKFIYQTAINSYDDTAGFIITDVQAQSEQDSPFETRWGVVLQWSGDPDITPSTVNQHNWVYQLAGMTSGRLYFRSRTNGGDWSTARKLMFDTDNIASSTKLQTARTLWGQSFDGTANVSGNMTGVGSISANGNNVITKTTTDNAAFVAANSNGSISLLVSTNRGIYDNSTNDWVIATNGTNTWLRRGNVGIGTDTPAYKLDVNGQAMMRQTLWLAADAGIQYVGAGMLIYKPSSGWIGIASLQWGVGAVDTQGVLRSNNNDLLHYRNGTHYPILTTYHNPSRSYTFMASTSAGGKWHHLGNYKTANDANNFAIMLYSGNGYNAQASQNSFARIVVKDGWQETRAAANSVGITVERFGNYDSSHEIKAVAVATSDREGALWVYLPWQYANGNYTISGVYGTWAHHDSYSEVTDGDNNIVFYADTTTEPTSNQRDTGYFDALYNTNIHGTITGHLIPGTNNAYTLGAVIETTNNGTTTYTDYFMKGVYTKRLYLSRTVYFELDSNGDVQLVGAGLWTDSFLSALGQNSSGGGGGGVGDVTWELLASNSDTRPIAWSHIQAAVTAQNYVSSSALSGYATQSWVQSQGYLTGNALVGYATESWVQTQGYLKSITSAMINNALGFTLSGSSSATYNLDTISSNATNGNTAYGWGNHANAGYWSSSNHPTTLANYGITDAKFGTISSDKRPITLGSVTQNVLIEHQSLVGYATQTWVTGTALNGYATQSWVNSQGFIKTVSGTFWGRSWSNGGTISGSIYAGSGGGIIDGFHSIELNSNGSLSDYGGFIDFHYNGASGDYTSRIIEDASGRLYLDADNGVRIGNAVLKWDNANNALYLQRSDGTAVNLYATGGISALGMQAGTSSVNAMTFNYLKINDRMTLPSVVVSDNNIVMFARNNSDSYGINMFYDYAQSKINFQSYYYNQYFNIGLHGNDYNEEETWVIDPDGCARFKRLYLDATRYLYISGTSLIFTNGTTSRTIATL